MAINDKPFFYWTYCQNKCNNPNIKHWNINNCIISTIYGVSAVFTVILISYLMKILIKKAKIQNKKYLNDIRFYCLLLSATSCCFQGLQYIFKMQQDWQYTVTNIIQETLNTIVQCLAIVFIFKKISKGSHQRQKWQLIFKFSMWLTFFLTFIFSSYILVRISVITSEPHQNSHLKLKFARCTTPLTIVIYVC